MSKKTYTLSEIESLIVRFEAEKLPKAEWTHEAHLIAAVWYLNSNSREAALEILRKKISNHNKSVGTPNSETEGYHESITRFWVWTIAKFIKENPFPTVQETCNALILSKTGSPKLPSEFYSKDLMFSVGARYNWQEPDLQDMVE